MTTITFYSYKGGVGRSLALANVARYLQRFGQNVFAIDFDLEAPGLHYKFGLDEASRAGIRGGLVDLLHQYCSEAQVPECLDDYVISLSEAEGSSGRLWLMPAGAVPTREYWRRLAQLNWHELFYSDPAPGIPLFLEVKHRIEETYRPDFLLIDSRTGVSEIGGVATTLLPDKLLCFLINNRENLEGAREVLRTIKISPRLPEQRPVEILPVLTRVPLLNADQEIKLSEHVRTFLNEDAPTLDSTLAVGELFLLHTESELELTESLTVGGSASPSESVLLRDYLRLFSHLVSREVVEPHVAPW